MVGEQGGKDNILFNKKSKKDMKGVYKITCTVNNKVYVNSSFDLERDLDEEMDKLYSNNHPNKSLQEDMNKYGETNFRKNIIEEYDGNDKNVLAGIEMKYKNTFPNHY